MTRFSSLTDADLLMLCHVWYALSTDDEYVTEYIENLYDTIEAEIRRRTGESSVSLCEKMGNAPWDSDGRLNVTVRPAKQHFADYTF